MTRFTKNAFKITPVQILGKTKTDESVDLIPKLLQERISEINKIPCNGWVRFQDATHRDALDVHSPIETVTLSNGIKIVAATSIIEIIDTQLKRSMKSVRYVNLPENEKYKIVPFDYVFYNDLNNNLICLVSAISDSNIKICLNEFLKNNPFADRGFAISDKPDHLRIPDDLFKWLFYKYYENKKIGDDIDIKSLLLADGNTPSPINSRIKLRYEGKAALRYLYELKFSLVDQRTFHRGGFILTIGGNTFEFILDDNGCVEFNPSDCVYDPEESDLALDNFKKAIYIYNTIIPKINKAYLNDTSWTREKEKFLLKCAEECITELDNNTQKIIKNQNLNSNGSITESP